MSMQSLGFRDLQYVIAVAEHASVSRAAEACAITQPALSERIRRIEFNLGVDLFERHKRNIRVSPIGKRFVAKAQQLLDEALELEDIVSAAHEPLGGPLRVGIIATLGPYLMPHVLPPLRRRYPNLDLVLQEGMTDALMARLQTGALDLVIAAAPLRPAGIRQLTLFDEPFVLAVPVDHELAKREEINAADLAGDEMVLLEEGHCLSGQALDVCPARQRKNRRRLHAMTLETLRHMVASGAGYTLLPALAVGKTPPLRKLVRYRSLGGTRQYGRRIVLATRASYSRQADIELFAQLVIQSLPEGVRPRL